MSGFFSFVSRPFECFSSKSINLILNLLSEIGVVEHYSYFKQQNYKWRFLPLKAEEKVLCRLAPIHQCHPTPFNPGKNGLKGTYQLPD
ncbi:hypothetical protein [Methylobacter tundripaludum]